MPLYAPLAPAADLLVVDAATVVTASLSEAGFAPLSREALVAPYLMWSEASSVLHELRWGKEISAELAATALERLASSGINPRRPRDLTAEAWSVAERLGWAKTYDAEYVALARLLRCGLLTTDAKVKASARGLAKVIGPGDL